MAYSRFDMDIFFRPFTEVWYSFFRRRVLCYLWFIFTLIACALSMPAGAISLKVDQVTLDSPVPSVGGWTAVSFRQTYAVPPLVFLLPDATNTDPSTLRIRNVTTSGFEVQRFEPDGSDGLTPGGQIQYLAITPGVYNLAPGVVLEAGEVSVSSFQSRLLPGSSWQSLSFTSAFPAPASLLVQLQSNNNGPLNPGTNPTPWLTVASANVTSTGAELALERSEVTSGGLGSAEQVGYLAITSNVSASFNDSGGQSVILETLRTARTITGWDNGCTSFPLLGSYTSPLVFGNKSTRNGGDGGWLRRCGLSSFSVGVTVDEDVSNDTERAHTTEEASLLIASQTFDAVLPDGALEADNVALSGVGGASLTFTQVNFPEPMTATPLIFTQPTEVDSAPAAVRVQNVTSSGFQIAAVEPPGSPGAHDAMTLDYIAVVPGVHRLSDGTTFEAGFVDTLQVQRGSNVGGPQGWETINFSVGFASTPTLLAQLQTTANNGFAPDPSNPFIPWLTTAVSGLTTGSVLVALERSEASAGSVASSERVGYLAFPENTSGALVDILGNTVRYDARRAPSAVQGFADGCFAVSYTTPFASVPLAVGHANTRNGNNGGWARRCAISNTALSQHIDEDQSNDTERNHIAEDISQLAFSQPFDWRPFPQIVLTPSLITVSDGISVSQPKSIPGAVLENQVVITNDGFGVTDTDSVELTFEVPAATSLFVGDLDGAGFPIVFTDGTGAEVSGLIWSAATDIRYSDDGGVSYDYTPAAGVEFDPAITHLQLTPAGTFLPRVGADVPRFSIRYRFQVR